MTAGKKTKKNNIGIFIITLIIMAAAVSIGLLLGWDIHIERKEKITTVKIEELPVIVQQPEESETVPTDDPGETEVSPTDEAKEETAEILPEKTGKYTEYLADQDAMSTDYAYALTPAMEEEITITFAGDLLLDDEYAIMASMLRRSGDRREDYISDAIDAPLLEEMRSADLCIINNEFPYTDRGEPTPDKMFTFRADTKEAGLLHDMGVDLVSIANNHASDFGEISLLDSMDTLKKEGIPYIGAGHNLKEAIRPIYYVTDNMKIAVLAATQIERLDNPNTKGATENSPGVFRCRNVELLLEQVQLASKNSDYVIVFVHWGTESTAELDIHQLDQAPRLAEAGADLIVGHHPHVLQGIDWIEGTPVVYSIGNFLFNSKTLDSCLVTATLDVEKGDLKSLRFIPAIQTGCRSTFPKIAEKTRILNYMQELSPNVAIDPEGYIFPKK